MSGHRACVRIWLDLGGAEPAPAPDPGTKPPVYTAPIVSELDFASGVGMKPGQEMNSPIDFTK